jgi:hypothetical protein
VSKRSATGWKAARRLGRKAAREGGGGKAGEATAELGDGGGRVTGATRRTAIAATGCGSRRARAKRAWVRGRPRDAEGWRAKPGVRTSNARSDGPALVLDSA